MKIGILGSDVVGQQLGLGFLKSGHEVKIGTRNLRKLTDWREGAGENGTVGSVAEAAKFGDPIVLATRWEDNATMNALNMGDKKKFRRQDHD